jgi:acetyl esterase/lipase
LSWRQIIESLEARDPSEIDALMPGPTPEDLARDFPELQAVQQHDLTIAAVGAPVRGRLYQAAASRPSAALVWVHGGAFIAGHLDMAEAHWVALMLAYRGSPVLSLDYRKCLHGVRFPAPSDDVLAGWLWAVEHADEIGVAPTGLHLGGASAGGNLTAGVTKRLRDGGGLQPASLVLAYPVLHAKLPEPSAELRAALTRAGLAPTDSSSEISLNFTGSEERFADPYAFAANGVLSGQPPVFVLNSEADELRASGEEYARRLEAAAVSVRLVYEPGTVHGHLNDPYSPGGRASLDRIHEWLGGGFAVDGYVGNR